MKKDFIKKLKENFYMRFHMVLILLMTFHSGLIFSKLSYHLGFTDLTLRYLLSFLFSYLIFLISIRIWLWYILRIAPENNTELSDVEFLDLWLVSKKTNQDYSGAGGDFSGGGSSSSWADADLDIDILDGADAEAVPLLLIAGIVIAILLAFFGGFYLLFDAPMFLGEIAFDLALTAGILKNKDKYHPVSWLSNVVKKTIIPVIIICFIIISLGLIIKHKNPEIKNSSQLYSWIVN